MSLLLSCPFLFTLVVCRNMHSGYNFGEEARRGRAKNRQTPFSSSLRLLFLHSQLVGQCKRGRRGAPWAAWWKSNYLLCERKTFQADGVFCLHPDLIASSREGLDVSDNFMERCMEQQSPKCLRRTESRGKQYSFALLFCLSNFLPVRSAAGNHSKELSALRRGSQMHSFLHMYK